MLVLVFVADVELVPMAAHEPERQLESLHENQDEPEHGF